MMFEEIYFDKAVPVFEAGCECELNHALKFVAQIDKTDAALLRIAGQASYQIFINGEFIHWGPARAGRGYYRVDEIEIGKYLTAKTNELSVLCFGYFCDSFQYLGEPSFLCAEVIVSGEAVAYTGGSGFCAYSYNEKIKRVQRYSYQRTFAEAYDIAREGTNTEVTLVPTDAKKFIKRRVSYPDFPREEIAEIYGGGTVTLCEPESYFADRAIVKAGDLVDGFYQKDTEMITAHLAERLVLTPKDGCTSTLMPENTYLSAAMKNDTTGFIELSVFANTDTELYITFDEILENGMLNFKRNSTSNVVLYKLCGGKNYKLITAEPYTFKYINVISVGGSIELKYLGMVRADYNEREIVRPLNTKVADDVITRIYNAALETFRQNTLDIFMDCPSRERAGWLCDSFFTARVERLMTGKSVVEKSFLENFLMEESYENLPDGMFPMCYPADFRWPEFIPNWAMFYFIELGEYLRRTGDRELIDAAEPKLVRLCEHFAAYENELGLLENPDGWLFVEWSDCSKFTRDVNYPTNMLYYKFLNVAYELYGNEAYKEKAERLREVIRRESRVGLFFSDNSLRREGKLQLTGECTETCQYYAFFSGVATPEEDGELWKTMIEDFGPERRGTGKWEKIYPSNAFIGNYLRLDLLAGAGLYERLEANIRGYFDYMAQRTGTLWEHTGTHVSCNHGFASHVLVWLDMLGYLN